LIKFALIGHIKRKKDSLWLTFLEQYGRQSLISAVLEDQTSPSRVDFMATHLNEDSDLILRIEGGDERALKDYYDFLMNEYLFWSYYNPHASPARLADRPIKIGSAAKDLIQGHIHRYIQNPSRNNPASLSQRSIGKNSSSQKIYKDKPTLDNPLYDLPEE